MNKNNNQLRKENKEVSMKVKTQNNETNFLRYLEVYCWLHLSLVELYPGDRQFYLRHRKYRCVAQSSYAEKPFVYQQQTKQNSYLLCCWSKYHPAESKEIQNSHSLESVLEKINKQKHTGQ